MQFPAPASPLLGCVVCTSLSSSLSLEEKEGFVLDRLLKKKFCPLCPLQNTFVTFAVDEGHSEYYLPYICLFNKINLFTIPYSNIYLGYELSSVICEIQSLMC